MPDDAHPSTSQPPLPFPFPAIKDDKESQPDFFFLVEEE